MAARRQDKINEEIARELTSILRTVKDPRVSGAFISVTILAFYLFGNCLRDALDPHQMD